MPRYTLSRQERLRSGKTISELFVSGNSFFAYPLRVNYSVNDSCEIPATSVQAAFSTSKRNFRHAVQRNLLKRRMREAFRLNKSALQNAAERRHVAVMFVYSAKEELEYHRIEQAMKQALAKLTAMLCREIPHT
ncbi:MAG: ribonuclease P protein component [Bacteroidales bacterium]|jgi:ribonuclease P protein component|nr:ribonuclease P protein component [Bacteroidales bacterium]